MLNTKTCTEQQSLPSNKNFGLTFTCFFLIISGLKLYAQQYSAASITLCFSMVVALFTFFVPQVLTPYNRLWTRFGNLLHSCTTPIILGLLYYTLFMPLGILMRVCGWDPLRLKYDVKAKTYWIERKVPAPGTSSMRNQF